MDFFQRPLGPQGGVGRQALLQRPQPRVGGGLLGVDAGTVELRGGLLRVIVCAGPASASLSAASA